MKEQLNKYATIISYLVCVCVCVCVDVINIFVKNASTSTIN